MLLLKLQNDILTDKMKDYFTSVDAENIYQMVQQSIYAGYINVFKYLITNDELKDKINIDDKSDEIFGTIYKKERLDMLKFIILDCNIEESKNIKMFLDEQESIKTKNPMLQEAKKLFNLRALNEKLDNDLNKNKGQSNDLNNISKTNIKI